MIQYFRCITPRPRWSACAALADLRVPFVRPDTRVIDPAALAFRACSPPDGDCHRRRAVIAFHRHLRDDKDLPQLRAEPSEKCGERRRCLDRYGGVQRMADHLVLPRLLQGLGYRFTHLPQLRPPLFQGLIEELLVTRRKTRQVHALAPRSAVPWEDGATPHRR